jgi:Uri superfamily endonuclease
MGPGGVFARLRHHSRISQRPHWHLDYLRRETEFVEAFALCSPERKECAWARLIASHQEASEPMTGFGSSDCKCDTHLFYFSSRKKAEAAIRPLEAIRKVPLSELA